MLKFLAQNLLSKQPVSGNNLTILPLVFTVPKQLLRDFNRAIKENFKKTTDMQNWGNNRALKNRLLHMGCDGGFLRLEREKLVTVTKHTHCDCGAKPTTTITTIASPFLERERERVRERN